MFYLCRHSAVDRAYPKYPQLPVIACPAYQPAPMPARDDKLTG